MVIKKLGESLAPGGVKTWAQQRSALREGEGPTHRAQRFCTRRARPASGHPKAPWRPTEERGCIVHQPSVGGRGGWLWTRCLELALAIGVWSCARVSISGEREAAFGLGGLHPSYYRVGMMHMAAAGVRRARARAVVRARGCSIYVSASAGSLVVVPNVTLVYRRVGTDVLCRVDVAVVGAASS